MWRRDRAIVIASRSSKKSKSNEDRIALGRALFGRKFRPDIEGGLRTTENLVYITRSTQLFAERIYVSLVGESKLVLEIVEAVVVIGFNEIFTQLSLLKLGVYTPTSYILQSRMAEYEAAYDTEVSGGGGRLRQRDREQSLRSLMTVNLLKRLESSVPTT